MSDPPDDELDDLVHEFMGLPPRKRRRRRASPPADPPTGSADVPEESPTEGEREVDRVVAVVASSLPEDPGNQPRLPVNLTRRRAMKRVVSALSAAVVAALGTFAVVSPADAATDPEPHYATGEWQLRDFAGPDIKTSPASESEATCDTVTLTKPDTDNDPAVYPPTGDGDVGTSYENTNLNLAVEAGDSLVVDYSLSDSANAAVGAVRMFVYDSPDADTINTPPTAFIAATDVTPSTLTITFGSAMTISTFGLTYDASNDTEGTVTFTNLKLVKGDQSVVLIALCAKPAPPTTEPTTPAETTTTTSAPTLPVTGASVGGLALIAVGLLAAGGVVVLVARRRRAEG